MTALELCTDSQYIFTYLGVDHKRSNASCTPSGGRQYSLYLFRESRAMRFEEWIFADAKDDNAVIHTESGSYNNSLAMKQTRTPFLFSDYFHDLQT